MRRLPFDYAVRNLGRSRSRLLLLVAGSALLVLIVLSAAAFVRGMGQSLRASGGEHNVMLLGTGSEESVQRSEVEMGVAGIASASIQGIQERGGVACVSPEVHVMLPMRTEQDAPNDGTLATVRGVTPAAMLVHNEVTIVEGRFPDTGRDEVMVGRTAATRLGVSAETLAIGEDVVIGGRTWTIVGRFAAGGTLAESEVWAEMGDLMEATKRESISCVVLTIDPSQVEFEDVAVFTMMRPDLELTVMEETEYYAGLSAFFAPIRAVVWITATLIVLGGFLGGLNTMYAAFVSRVREFGTLQSIGFRRRSIVLSLMQESTVATAAGTLLACAIGVWLLDGISVRFSMGAFGLLVDSTVIALALGVGFAMGLLGALPPAFRCLRLPIPSALKSI